jgi:TonB-linked SusC/RagA family outer membrane protein
MKKSQTINGWYVHPLKKTFLIMRITVFLLFAGFLSLIANESYSQRTKLNVHYSNTSLEKVLDAIENQSEFFFLYNEKLIDVQRKVTIRVKDTGVDEVLNQLFAGTDIQYSIVDRKIVLAPEDIASAVQQQRGVSGTVTDRSNAPLPGVTVVVKGTTTGTITDNTGNYSLSNVTPNATLVFSFIGMRTQEVATANQSSINITMVEETVGIEEVVAVGYGVQKKANLTGAVGHITSEVLENRAIQNAGQGLQGTIGNLNIVTNPGDPGKIGQGANYQIRGQGSIQGGAPLVLIDGVQGDLNQINPNDIDNISVLKDAASAAIYGARATFGVILVTTKKGSASRISVSVNSSMSSNSITNFPKVVNSLVYAEVMNEASRNAGIADYFPAEQIERIKRYLTNPGSIPTTIPDPNDPTRWSYALGNDNVNYMKVYYKDHMLSQKHDLAISGGSEKLDYRFSAGYLDQDGVYAFGQDVFKRYNILGNVNATLTQWLTFKFQTMLNVGVTDEPFEYAGNMGNYFHTAYTRQPHWAFYDPNGNPLWTSQKQFFEGARRITKNDEIKMLGEVVIVPLTGWTINTRVSYNKQLESGTAHESKLYAWDVNNNPYTLYGNSSFTKSYWARDYKNLELFSTYNRQLNEHYITGLIGMQAEEFISSSLFGNVRNLITDEIPSLNTGTGVKNTGEGIDEWFNIGYFGRLNYNYKEKYLFEANARYDATSKFPDGRRWGLFPSVSGGWNIAKEEFFNLPKVNMLKLRASYGLLGNQQINNYLFFSRVPIYANLGHILGGVRPNYIGAPGLVSNNLTWATATTLDFGLDIQALENRLSFSFDWYTRTTTDMVGPANAVPSVLGTSVPQTNNADMVTRGFELTVGWRDRIGNDFNHSIQFNLSDYLSEITKYNNPNKLLSTYYEGQKLGEIWGFETIGLIQTNEQLANMADQKTHIYNGTWYLGDVEYRDLNNDEKISYGSNTLSDPGDRKVIGNNTPRYSFGLIYNANWKGFDFNMFWQGIMKRDVWLGDIPFFGITGSWTQQIYETTLDYWSPSNTGAYFARPYATNQTTKNQLVQTRFLQNAAYARLKNIQIGYSLPESILNSLKLQKIRIYVSGENLFYLSSIDENFDPERIHGSWGSGKTYPLFRTLTAGISLTL